MPAKHFPTSAAENLAFLFPHAKDYVTNPAADKAAEKALEKQIFSDLRRGRLNYVKRLIPLCKPKLLSWIFRASCRYGHEEIVHLLMPFTTPKISTEMLRNLSCLPISKYSKRHRLVFSERHLRIAQQLLSLCDPKEGESTPLRSAVSNDNVEMVKILLPLSNPLVWSSEGLLTAARKGNREMFNLLLPFSDPEAAWRELAAFVDKKKEEVTRTHMSNGELRIESNYPRNVLFSCRSELEMMSSFVCATALRDFLARHPDVVAGMPALSSVVSRRLLEESLSSDELSGKDSRIRL